MLDQLPVELIDNICSYLPISSLANLQLVSKYIKNTSNYQFNKKTKFFREMRYIHNFYDGDFNCKLDDNDGYVKADKLKFKETIEIFSLGNPYNPDKKIKVTYLFQFWENHVFKNLRFSSPLLNNIVESAELVIGGTTIDRLNGSLFSIIRSIYKINDETVLPFYFCTKHGYLRSPEHHEIRINMTMRPWKDLPLEFDDFSLLCDIYECDSTYEDAISNGNGYRVKHMVSQLKFDPDVNINYLDEINLWETTHLIVKLNDFNIQDIYRFEIVDNNIYRTAAINFDVIEKYGDYYIIPLNYPDNSGPKKKLLIRDKSKMSPVEKLILRIELYSEGGKIDIYRINLNFLIYMSGMVGIRHFLD